MKIDNAPKRYLPFIKGTYQVAAGLAVLKPDTKIFDFDQTSLDYLEGKVKARDEDLSKYYVRGKVKDHELKFILRFIARTLAREYPNYFKLVENDEVMRLECLLTDEYLNYDDAYFDAHNSSLLYDYKDGLDAMVSQIPDDVAIWRREQTKEFLALAHLCAPNHWDPNDKVGKSFNEVHAPVGDWQSELAPKAQALVSTMIEKGPYERFAWGLATDDRLNHHPRPPAGIELSQWQGRNFSKENPALFVRVERQVLCPFSELGLGLSLFFIRTYFYDVLELSIQERAQLVSALKGMSAQTLHYKGLSSSQGEIIEYLEGLNS